MNKLFYFETYNFDVLENLIFINSDISVLVIRSNLITSSSIVNTIHFLIFKNIQNRSKCNEFTIQ